MLLRIMLTEEDLKIILKLAGILWIDEEIKRSEKDHLKKEAVQLKKHTCTQIHRLKKSS